MDLKVAERGEDLLVRPEGEVLWDSCNELRDAVLAKIDVGDSPCKTLWLHLEDVTLIDSVGLGILMGIKMTCHRLKVRLVLVEPSEQVNSTLQVVKFTSIFEILSEEEARAECPELFAA